ncbi:MAG: pyridoxal 5'-phosphate synthase glutaminase subunit PdxT [Clostridium sp.]
MLKEDGKLSIGVLSLQGGVEEHINHILLSGNTPIEVKTINDLEKIDAIILPGGESTTIGKLLKITRLLEPLRNKIINGLPTWGTCAGMILLAKNILGEDIIHLNILDISVTRNGFGSQLDSFNSFKIIENISFNPIELVFIRAPYINEVGEKVIPLCSIDNKIVAAQSNNILVTSFHPELTSDLNVLNYFINKFIIKKDYHI